MTRLIGNQIAWGVGEGVEAAQAGELWGLGER
jgi:hypothetical protein